MTLLNRVVNATSPSSSDLPYVVLQQLITTKLNIANGSHPFALGSVLSGSDSWLQIWKPGRSPTGGIYDEGLYYAAELRTFNTGEIGPGACL